MAGKPEVVMELEEYLEMRRAAEMFYALKDAGVDNWDGYDEAIEFYEESVEIGKQEEQ